MGEGIHKLTSGMAAGDDRAVTMFYRDYFDWLYRQARRATRRDESFCLDVVQDAVLRILRNVRAVETEAQWKAWMALVVNTTALDRLRAEGRRSRREMAMAGARTTWTAGDDQPAEDQVEWLREQIGRMDPQLIALIDMRYKRGWTLQRAAQTMGLSVGTIDGRLRRPVGVLRQRAREDRDV